MYSYFYMPSTSSMAYVGPGSAELHDETQGLGGHDVHPFVAYDHTDTDEVSGDEGQVVWADPPLGINFLQRVQLDDLVRDLRKLVRVAWDVGHFLECLGEDLFESWV